MGRIKTMRVVQNSLFCVHLLEYLNGTVEDRITEWNLDGTEQENSSRFYEEKVLRINNSGNLVAILGK
jgi:hypothetical protein